MNLILLATMWPPVSVYRRCYAIARRAHRGQLYGDRPYFRSHVLPLSKFFEKRDMWGEACLALLHDTIEDHPDKVSYDSLTLAGVPIRIVQALDHITKRLDESYEAYLRRVMADDMAWRVKLQDVIQNVSYPGAGRRRLMKYAWALQTLAQDAPTYIIAP